MYLPSLLCLDFQGTKKGLFLRVIGSKGSDFDSGKFENEEDHLCWCFMCKSSGEDVDHLSLHCQIANWLWRLVLNLFGMQ